MDKKGMFLIMKPMKFFLSTLIFSFCSAVFSAGLCFADESKNAQAAMIPDNGIEYIGEVAITKDLMKHKVISNAVIYFKEYFGKIGITLKKPTACDYVADIAEKKGGSWDNAIDVCDDLESRVIVAVSDIEVAELEHKIKKVKQKVSELTQGIEKKKAIKVEGEKRRGEKKAQLKTANDAIDALLNGFTSSS